MEPENFDGSVSPEDQFSILLGVLSIFGSALMLGLGLRSRKLLKTWLEDGLRRDDGSLRVWLARLLLRGRRMVSMSPVLFPIGMLVMSVRFVDMATLGLMAIGCLLGVGIVSLAIGWRPWSYHVEDVGAQLALGAAQQIGRDLPEADAVRMLWPAAQSGDVAKRVAAAWGYAALGGEAGRNGLRVMLGNARGVVLDAVMVAGESLLLKQEARVVRSIADLPGLVVQHRQALELVSRKQDSAWAAEALGTLAAEIDALVDSQRELLRSGGGAYCLRCNRRPSFTSYQQWRWIYCPSCNDVAGMVPDVLEVWGVVGKEGVAKVVERGILRLGIWDKASRQVLDAEVDGLEVHADGGADTEWAIAAVHSHLSNRSVLPLRLGVRVVGVGELDRNSQRLLDGFGAQSLG